MRTFILLLLLLPLAYSCKRKWTDKNKSEFVSGCMSTAVRDKNIGDSLARPYCNCLLEKIMEKYPDANDAQYIRYDTAAVRLSRDCLRKL